MIDFASDVDALVGWYSIGANDTDIVEFAYHLLAAFQQISPDFGEDILDYLITSGGNVSPDALSIEFINAIESQILDFCTLILDDYHLVVDNPPIVEFIDSLLDNLPDQIRMIIGSRSVYGIPTANLYVREDLFTLGADELRFRADELQSLVQQTYHVKLSDDQAQELAARADGWIVAILLAVHTLEHGGLPKFEGATEQVYTYLAREVIQRLPDRLQKFLMATSILDEFSEPLCDYLLNDNSSGETLTEIEGRNLFITRVETQEGIGYRYHHLFVEFLRERLAKEDPELKAKLHARAADWYRQHDAWESAVNHKLAAGERKVAAEWIDRVANAMSVSGRHQVLSVWYDALAQDPDMRSYAPHFMVDWAKILIDQSAYDSAETLLDIAESNNENPPDIDQQLNAIIAKGYIRLFQRDYQGVIDLANDSFLKLKQFKSSTKKKIRRYQTDRLIGMALNYIGMPKDSLKHLGRAAEGFRDLSGKYKGREFARMSHDLAETLSDMGFVSYQHGYIDKAQSAFQEALDIRRKVKSNRGALALARNNVAYIYYLAGQNRQAWREYDQALADARAAQRSRILIDVLNSRGDLLCDLDEFTAAENNYKEAIQIANNLDERIDKLSEAYVGLSNIERRRGNFNDAIHWLREAASNLGESIEKPSYQVDMGEIYFLMGQMDLAQESLNASLVGWEGESHFRKEHSLAAFFLAASMVAGDQIEEAGEWLTRAMKWSAKLGYDNFLVNAGRSTGTFLEIAKTNWPTKQLSSLILRVHNHQVGTDHLEAPEKPAEVPTLHLDVTAFGNGEVRRNGELIPGSQWRSNRARSLFFYLLDNESVRKEDVALDFWPEFSPARVSSNFHATLWRVRNALGGSETILFEEGRYSLHPEITLWYDAAEFQECILKANEDGISNSQQVELLRSAVNLYTGGFLDSVFMNWADQRRKEFQDEYSQALMSLAKLEVANNQYLNAKAFCETLLEFDPFHDEAHLMLMKCLVKSGSSKAANDHYQKYKKTLQQELDTDPPAAIQSFADGLSLTE